MSDGCGTYARWPLHVWVPDEALVRPLRELGDVEAQLATKEQGLPDDAADVELIVAPWSPRALEKMIAATPKLRVVQTMSAGVDAYLPLIPERVKLCDAAGVHAVPVAEWVLAAILGANWELPLYARRQAAREWEPAGEPAREIAGSRVVIVGHGTIGVAVQERLEAFGATVTGVARRARDGVRGADELPDLLPDADVVVLLLPLTEATRGTVDAAFLRRMRDGALLVNAGRGPLVDTDALVAELASGRLRAALDVTEPEPLPVEHPLWDAPNLLLTPHVAGTTRALMGRLAPFVAQQVARYRDGKPLANVVSDGY